MHFTRKNFQDERGSFSELFRQENTLFKGQANFVQDNFSCSHKGVLRGLHFQKNPHEQGKLITCLKGSLFDVALDLRPTSKTFKKHWTFTLTQENAESLYIPEGFAHGFCALRNETFLFYKTTKYYNSSSEITLQWDDKNLGINWPLKRVLVSAKDKKGLSLKDFLENHC